MNLYFRLIWLLLTLFRRPALQNITDTSRIRFHVLPLDLDFNMHMNNGRYLTLMDLGRMDLILRLGLLKVALKNKYGPVLASAKMRWRIQLRVFQPFDLETRVICWDEKWVYMEQRFVIAAGDKKGAVAAIGILKGGFFDPKTHTTVPNSHLLKMVGIDTPSPPMPDYIVEWQRAEESLKEVTAAP